MCGAERRAEGQAGSGDPRFRARKRLMSGVDRSRLPAVGRTPPFHFAAIRKDRLQNQLAVWTAEHRGLPLVSILLVLPQGSAADFDGYEGLAAITADMLDEGSGDRSAIEINAAFARIGAHL